MQSELLKIGIAPKYHDSVSLKPLKSYFLYGDIGTGKTYEAAGLAREALRQGLTTRFYSMARLFDAILGYDRHDPSDYTLSSIRNCGFLVIDDLGKEKLTEWKYEQLFEVIDHRYGHEKMTCITSNYSLSELADKWGENIGGQAIVSRIAEMCSVVKLTGEDRRLG